MVKKILKISGMDCVSCAMSIDGDLEETRGVKSAKTNYAKGHCEIEFDEEVVTVETLVKAVKNTGYAAEEK